MDVSHPRLFINVGAANGRALEEVTEAKLAEIASILGETPSFSFGNMLDGVPANQFDRVPGQDFSRQVIFIRGDRLYTLSFIPDDPETGNVYLSMQDLYELVMDSFSFLRQKTCADVRQRSRALPRIAGRQIVGVDGGRNSR